MDEELIDTQKNDLEDVQGEYEEVEIKHKEVRTDSYFDGGLLELIGWRILAFFITGITFGIGAPWAQCMLYSWEYKHTVLNGKRLKFEGTGGDLFVQYFKWIFFSIITFGIYILVIPVRETRWVVSNLHFEDEQFIKDESYFDGKTIQLIGVNIICNIITTLSLGLLFPFTVCYKRKWICKHTIINRKKLLFYGNGFSLFGKYLLWLFLTIITLGIYGLWLPIKMLKWQTKYTRLKRAIEVEPERDNSLLIPITIIILVVLVASIVAPGTYFIFNKIKNNKVVKNLEKSVTQTINSNEKKKIIHKTKSIFNSSGKSNSSKKTTTKKSTTKKKSTKSNKKSTGAKNSTNTEKNADTGVISIGGVNGSV